MLASFFGGFVLLAIAAFREPPPWARYLVPAACVLIFAGYLQIDRAADRTIGGEILTDALMYQEYSARLFLAGENPYGRELHDAYRVHRAPLTFSTPLIGGEIAGRLPYPALSFLLFVPFFSLGLSAELVFPLLLSIALALVYFAAPEKYRPVALLPFLADPNYFFHANGGVGDIAWAILLSLMVIAWRRPFWRAVLFGLAASYKQLPWFAAPFLLVRIFWENPDSRRREIFRFVLGSVLVFGVINAPFIIWNPAAWIAGVFDPLLSPMQIFGQGASVLTTVGWAAIPKTLYVVGSYGLLLIFLVAYARHYPRAPHLIWILTGLALWFGFRSLASYWYYFLFPFAVELFRDKEPVIEAPHRSVRPDLAAVAAAFLLFAGGAIYSAARPSELELTLIGPHGVVDNRIIGTTVELGNNTDRPIEPRFQMQTHHMQPFFWEIRRGPRVLEPGASAVYEIGSLSPIAHAAIERGARISVHPADVYEPRAAGRIEEDRSWLRPETIPNSKWVFWSKGVPTFWESNSLRGHVSYSATVARSSLRFDVSSETGFARAAIGTDMLMPESPFEVDVLPPRGASAFGIELIHNNRKVRTIFRAPPAKWSRHRVDARKILRSAGIPIVTSRKMPRRFAHLDFPGSPMRIISLSRGKQHRRAPHSVYRGD